MSHRSVSRALAASAAGLFLLCASAHADVVMSGPLPQGYWSNLLHLGATFETDSLTANNQNIYTDCLAAAGGEANQTPGHGDVLTGLATHGDSQEPAGQLTWTAMDDADGFWQPNRDAYIKYWHTYVIVPGNQPRPVHFYLRQDDDVRIWNNGSNIVTSIGWDNHTEKGPFAATLQPGRNSITIKLYEGGGGDYMAIRMTDVDGTYFDDLSYTLVPVDFTVANPLNGGETYTGTNAVVAVVFPMVADGTHYQFTAGDDASLLSPAAWKPYAIGAMPDDIFDFPAPDDGATVTIGAWVMGNGFTNGYSDTILYSTSRPSAVATNISIGINNADGTEIPVSLVDAGSTGGDSGIASMTVSPSILYAPGNVTLTVVNHAGLSDSATVMVSQSGLLAVHVSPDGDDDTADGSPEKPFRTVTEAAARVAPTPLEAIYIAPGLYDADAGESFPVALKDTRIVNSGAGPAIFDGGNAAAHIFTAVEGSLSLLNLAFRGSTDAALSVRTTPVAATNCVFTQSQPNFGWGATGALRLERNCALEAVGCVFTNISRTAVIRCTDINGANEHNGSPVTLRDCLLADNVAGAAGGANDSSLIYTRNRGSSFSFYDTVFRNNETGIGTVHDASSSPVVYADFSPVDIDRCQFLGNRGGNLLGVCYANASIRNSLFVDNDNPDNIYHGYSTSADFRNCTFVRGTGGFTGYTATANLFNCILADLVSLNVPSTNHGGSPDRLRIRDTLIWNTPAGIGYDAHSSANIIEADPVLENAGVAFSDAGFDPRPRPYSPAIDASAAENVAGAFDLDGHARAADNDGDALAVADLGCYESLFHAAIVPTFSVPVPGSLSGYRGVTYPVTIGISPAAEGPVEAAVTYSEGVTGPAALSFSNGSATVVLNVETLGSTNTFARITIAESNTSQGVLPGILDVFMDDLVVTVGGETNLFVRAGDSLDLPVALALGGAVAPDDVSINVGAIQGTGTSAAAWHGESAKIPAGQHSSAPDALRITGGIGINAVTLSTGTALFLESGDSEVTLRIVGYPGCLYVDPANGDDSADGTLASPLKSVTKAITLLKAGDEVRLLPGTYTAATETFPWRPGSLALVGCDATGAKTADRTLCVVDGENGVDHLANVLQSTGSAAGRIEGLWIRNSTDSGLFIENSDCVVSNCFFTQDTASNVGGGIRVANVSQADVVDCCFSGMTRRAAIYCTAVDNAEYKRLSALRCLFIDNTSYLGAIGCTEGNQFRLYATDCDFIRNVGDLDTNVHDARASAAFYNGGNRLFVDRCRFLANSGNHVVGIEYAQENVLIANSLFVDNATAGGAFRGYSATIDARNCTFIRNAGGYAIYGLSTYIRNSIFSGDTALSLDDGSAGRLRLRDSMVHEIGEGDFGYVVEAPGTVATNAAPLFRNAAIAWDAEGFNARLGNDSPAIDAGNADFIFGDLDLDGTARMKYGRTRRFGLKVDLGCYEADVPPFGTLLLVR
ncbi:MAG: right-handed parallel beta-helix repeat-containing protein [Kiritimatiellia bacterium]|jgi:hypothetical protein